MNQSNTEKTEGGLIGKFKITKIEISDVDGRKIELSMDEAKALHRELSRFVERNSPEPIRFGYSSMQLGYVPVLS